MEKLPMCRICLVQNVRMYIVLNKNLHELYETLTDNPFITNDNRPIIVCDFCCTKLKQCCRFQRKCLEAEDRFAQMINEDYEAKPVINQNQYLECFNGFIQSPMVHVSTIDEYRTESDAIIYTQHPEHLPAVCERPDDMIKLKQEHESDELELENVVVICSDTEDEEIKEVLTEKQRASDTQQLELENVVVICSDTEDEEIQEILTEKRRASDTQQHEMEKLIVYNSDTEEEETHEVLTEYGRASFSQEHEMEKLIVYCSDKEDLHLKNGLDLPLMEVKTEEEETHKVLTENGRASFSQEHEMEKLIVYCSDKEDLHLKNGLDLPLMEVKTEEEETQKVPTENGRASFSQEHEMEKLIVYCSDKEDLHLKNGLDLPLMEVKTEEEETQKVPTENGRASFSQEQELENLAMFYSDMQDLYLENGLHLPLMDVKTEEEETYEVLTENQRASDSQQHNTIQQNAIEQHKTTAQQSQLKDGLPLMKIKTGVEKEQAQEILIDKRRASDTQQHNTKQQIATQQHTTTAQQSQLKYGLPLIKIKTGVEKEQEQEIMTDKRRASDMQKPYLIAIVTEEPGAKPQKPLWFLWRKKLEDKITEEHKKTDHSDTIVTQSQNCTSKPVAKSKKPLDKKKSQKNSKKIKNKIKKNSHQRLCSKEKPFKCIICLRSFYQNGHLQQHFRIHTDEKPFKCEICFASFNVKNSLLNHNRIHTGQRPFKCDTCQHCFSDKEALKKHIRIHTGEKPYKCHLCQRCFTQSSSLKIHLLWHTGEKPFKCEICKVAFYRQFCLTVHSRIHTYKNPFKCHLCVASFLTERILLNHIRIHTGQKP